MYANERIIVLWYMFVINIMPPQVQFFVFTGDGDKQFDINDFGYSTECATTKSTTKTSITTTTIASTTTPTVSTVRSTCRCPCNKVGDPALNNMTVAETLKVVKQIKQELMVDKSELSSTKRKKISAPDERPSSRGLGALGIVVLISILCMLIIGDAHAFGRDFTNCLRNVRIFKQDV